MDSAVIRVKRRITDEPFDKFVLNCKRAKLCKTLDDENQHENDSSSDATQTILKFAATINAEDDIATHLTKLRKPEAEELAKKIRKPPSVLAKLRQQLKDESKEQRYKVVNCFRSMNEASTSNGAAATKANITVFDVIKDDNSELMATTPDTEPSGSINLNGPQSEDKFVFDLYYIDDGDQPTEINPNDYISLRPFDDFDYEAADYENSDTDDINSEDSNNEANYRNDYPDTDSDFSVKDNDIRAAVENLAIDSDVSSSDDGYPYGHVLIGPTIESMSGDSGDEFNYFKKMGQVRRHQAFYRRNLRRFNRHGDSDSDSSIHLSSVNNSNRFANNMDTSSSSGPTDSSNEFD